MEEHAVFLKTLLDAQPEFTSGLRQLLDYCRSVNPSAPWHELEQVDFDADADAFRSWLDESAPDRIEAQPVRAYYLGLPDDGAELHLDGTPTFEPEDDTCDWACSFIYRAEDEWTSSQALFAFASISEQADDEIPALLYLLCLGYTGLLAQLHAPAILRKPVAVGFDDGDAFVAVA